MFWQTKSLFPVGFLLIVLAPVSIQISTNMLHCVILFNVVINGIGYCYLHLYYHYIATGICLGKLWLRDRIHALQSFSGNVKVINNLLSGHGLKC